MELKYAEILRRNAVLSESLRGDRCEIAILSNIVVSQLKEILEYSLRVAAVPATVTAGDYDNIVQDSLKFRDSNLVIIFWEVCNIIDGLQFKIELYDEQMVNELFERTRSEIDFVFKNLAHTSLVLFNKFSGIHFSSLETGNTRLERFSDRLNQYLQTNTPRNVFLVDLEKVIAHTGVYRSIDLRNFYSSRALYSIDFLKAYSRHIKPYVLSANGKSKKVLILDCDNTLWKGVLGEEGCAGIEMSPATKDGAIFAEVQNIALSLNLQGVLIGLCSKNNPEDVDEVFQSHPDMQLKDEHIAVRRVNWKDKVSNLKEMSLELNLGLDSFVMVDDSAFEVNLIKEQLPEVTILQVPAGLSEYPRMLRENRGLFYNLSATAEDATKSAMYKEQGRRENSKLEFSDIRSYLTFLEMKMTIYRDDKNRIPRLAQLSQKTNQFNLMTRRYTERDIESFIEDDRVTVFGFSLSDRFGDYGITGLGITRMTEDKCAVIDSFLMSCRVIGRDVEFAFMDCLLNDLKASRVEQVSAQYLKSPKNAQVVEFLDRCSFRLTGSTESERNYELCLNEYKTKKVEYIEIQYGRPN